MGEAKVSFKTLEAKSTQRNFKSFRYHPNETITIFFFLDIEERVKIDDMKYIYNKEDIGNLTYFDQRKNA